MSRLPILLAIALVGCKIHVYEQGNGHDPGEPNTGSGVVDARVECSSYGEDGSCDQGYEVDSGGHVTSDAGGWNTYPDGGWNTYPDGGWNTYPDGGWNTYPDGGWTGFVDAGIVVTSDAGHP